MEKVFWGARPCSPATFSIQILQYQGPQTWPIGYFRWALSIISDIR